MWMSLSGVGECPVLASVWLVWISLSGVGECLVLVSLSGVGESGWFW